MLLTACLAVVVCGSLLLGTLPLPLLFVLSLGVGAVGLCVGHTHRDIHAADKLARQSRLHQVHPGLKLWGSLALLALSIAARVTWVSLLIALVALVLATLVGGLSLRRYLRALALPATFLLLSALPLLWDFGVSSDALLVLPCFGIELSLTHSAQAQAGLVLARALGALASLLTLTLSTTLPELLTALRRVHVPALLLDLAVLLYRYLFIVLETQRSMQQAATLRLAYTSLRRSLRTTGLLYGRLLARSFRRAGAHFDAMESRCYRGELRFLTRPIPLRWRDVIVLLAVLLPFLFFVLYTY